MKNEPTLLYPKSRHTATFTVSDGVFILRALATGTASLTIGGVTYDLPDGVPDGVRVRPGQSITVTGTVVVHQMV